jgi:hypothetical protein
VPNSQEPAVVGIALAAVVVSFGYMRGRAARRAGGRASRLIFCSLARFDRPRLDGTELA